MIQKRNMIYLLSSLALTALIMACTEKEKKEIVCWGDSLTAPHRGTNIKNEIKRLFNKEFAYPEYLQNMLGDEYEIINGGVGGENTLTIMARQGAYPMKLSHDVVLFNSDKIKFRTFIGNNDINTFISSYNNKPISPLIQGGWDENSSAQVNPCTINGKSFHLSSEAIYWREDENYKFEYNYYIDSDEEVHNTYTIKAGSVVETYAMKNLRNKYANIFFIGQNGGFENTSDLIRQLQAMINYSQSNRYIIISFHIPNGTIKTIDKMKEMEDSLSNYFGKHFINLREYMVTQGLSDAGLIPTQEDKDSIVKGRVPPQIMTDGCHFTTKGYEGIARIVYSKMKELNY